MFLRLECTGAEGPSIYELEIRSSNAKPPDDQVTGVSFFNRVMLYRRYFDDFIEALAIDDFEAIKAIFARVIDVASKQLAFENIRQVDVGTAASTDLF